jgi:hypothetical protein
MQEKGHPISYEQLKKLKEENSQKTLSTESEVSTKNTPVSQSGQLE